MKVNLLSELTKNTFPETGLSPKNGTRIAYDSHFNAESFPSGSFRINFIFDTP